ncbi:hypothetical protein DCAR_0936055 [Daucus carota subsp. sativus]|uniref:Uncharacterized protein n=1 Tax=Daucus carota subsp. sativus TaxID=79200 RepID=A0A175YIZ6_DAUCS|nr:PREDICTED: mitogen-activated protein kinase kinase kinase 2-like [Daucus carota subsp. sativus]WOH16500.1 hypothetical protein DCAR_0936055 [Daucus carota subsp. sativus]
MASRWVPTKFLGQGSYGCVFRAEFASPSLAYACNVPRTVAVKSVSQSLLWSLAFEKSVLCELGGCKEIVRCFEDEDFKTTNEDGTTSYNIVLEYADGGTLKQLIYSRGRIPEYEASCYALMLLKGLSRVHGQGYVHCDMKPSNVLVFNIPRDEFKGVVKCNLKLADFGLAKKGGEKSLGAGEEYKHRGTLLYNSPESVVFGVHEAAMDIWAVGCIVLELLLGEGGLWKKRIDEDAQCLAEMIVNYEDDRLILLVPELDHLSENAKDFVRRCLTRRPEDRWTADELLRHPFVTCNQKLVKQFEARYSYQNLMKYQYRKYLIGTIRNKFLRLSANECLRGFRLIQGDRIRDLCGLWWLRNTSCFE